VTTTRGRWYPKWILFTASQYGVENLLAKRVVVGQVVCDVAIESGNAIPGPAARNFAGYWSGGDSELEEWAVQQWAVWYRVKLRSNDVTSFNNRFVFFNLWIKPRSLCASALTPISF
jgi:hypothetical protein